MPTAEPQSFTRLADGTTLLRRADGSYEPVHSLTDHARLAALTDAEIERMSADDTDHPALDNAFWNAVDQQAANETITISRLLKKASRRRCWIVIQSPRRGG